MPTNNEDQGKPLNLWIGDKILDIKYSCETFDEGEFEHFITFLALEKNGIINIPLYHDTFENVPARTDLSDFAPEFRNLIVGQYITGLYCSYDDAGEMDDDALFIALSNGYYIREMQFGLFATGSARLYLYSTAEFDALKQENTMKIEVWKGGE